jgi:hypothetical protein
MEMCSLRRQWQRLSLGSTFVVIGSQFRGVPEGWCGNSKDSSADYPLVQLRSIESGQTTYLLSTNWSTNSFTSLPAWNFPPGYALATVFVDGMPGTSSIVSISVPVPAATTLTEAKNRPRARSRSRLRTIQEDCLACWQPQVLRSH